MKININSFIRGVLLSGGLSVLLNHSPANAQSSATMVIPGKRIGSVSLGMTVAQVRKALGKPQQRGRLSSTLSSETFALMEVTYKGGRVVQLETDSARFRTKSGLFAHSRMDAIDARLGPQIHSVRTDPENYILHYFDGVKTGLAFEWSGPKTGDVRRDDEVQSLIVHRKGVPVIVNRGSEWISSTSVLVLTDPNEGNS